MSRNPAVLDRLEEVPTRHGWHSPAPWTVARLVVWGLAGVTGAFTSLILLMGLFSRDSTATAEISLGSVSAALFLGIYVLARSADNVLECVRLTVTRRDR